MRVAENLFIIVTQAFALLSVCYVYNYLYHSQVNRNNDRYGFQVERCSFHSLALTVNIPHV